MGQSVSLRCQCGKVEGVLDLAGSQRGCCYCDDCRAFARALGRDDILDEAGGSDIVQVRPAHLRITRGAEYIACLRLSPTGMFRFHTACCRTPLGNVMDKPRLPFIGVARAALVVDDAALPPIMRIQGRFATRTPPPGTAQTVTPSQALRTLRFLATSALSRSARPHPYFDDNGAPIAAPRVLTPEEREALRARDVRPAA